MYIEVLPKAELFPFREIQNASLQIKISCLKGRKSLSNRPGIHRALLHAIAFRPTACLQEIYKRRISNV